MDPKRIIPEFDAYLAERSVSLDAVTLGGAALILAGVVKRDTVDCDILHPDLPVAVLEAAKSLRRGATAAGRSVEGRLAQQWPGGAWPDFAEGLA
jgi:hypothetical protein